MNYKFAITEDIFNRCSKFAADCVSTNIDKYAQRNQFDVDKIEKDIRAGKVGEELVYNYLITLYPNISKPDHNIYQKNNKSWDSDLRGPNGLKIAVKSQDIYSAIHFGESWVFQKGNYERDVDTEIFGSNLEKKFVAFVALNIPKRTGEIRAIVSVKTLHDENLFKPMQKESLQGNKVAIYYSDLELLTEKYQLGALKAL
jgi:hypothetical protein